MSCQTRVCVEGKREHTKHMLRLCHVSPLNSAEANEIVLLNSLDGTSNWRCDVSSACSSPATCCAIGSWRRSRRTLRRELTLSVSHWPTAARSRYIPAFRHARQRALRDAG
ncbi:hypothetical protein [Pectobacterium versatile]|uniref:hypothetical protein n=1 Tax=Pectobacterium versatile TaxID=2488639 RepID=UPI003F9B02A1